MGNLLTSFGEKPHPDNQKSSRRSSNSRQRRIRLSAWWSNFRECMLPQQAVKVKPFGQYPQNGRLSPSEQSPLVRRRKSSRPKKSGHLTPNSSSVPVSPIANNLLSPFQLDEQDIQHDFETTTHFVLVHGGGFGAWCWYKTVSLLEDSGFNVTAINLTGSGIHSCDANAITSLSHYVKPLTDFLEQLSDGNKVILVGHDLGGTCISYAMELFPSKISKAVYIAAAMLPHGQSTLDMFSKQEASNDLMRQAQVFQYANGTNHLPTAIELDKSLLKDLLFNRSSSKDVTLASLSMGQIPFAPALEKLSLSANKYGSVRRFYIQTVDDNAIPITLQESMINSSPPEKVFIMRGADHSPFFSKPQALHKLFVEISRS